MKRKILPIAALLGAVFLPTALQAQDGGLRIAFINSQVIVQEAPGAAEAQQQFDRDMARYRTEVQEMGQELQQMVAQYEQQQLTMSPEAKEAREAEIRQAQNEYQQRIQQLEQQAGQRQAELVEPVMERISLVIEEIRAEGDYHMIFDVSTGAVISADPALDLTEEVIRRLRARGTAATGGGMPDTTGGGGG